MANGEINIETWAPLQEKIVADILEKSKELWLKAPQKEWLTKLAGEVAEYKYKMESAKLAGELEKAQVYKDALDMVLSQVEARSIELKMNIKIGMLDTLKKIILEVLQFAIKLALPL